VTDDVSAAAAVSLSEIRTPAKSGGLLASPGPLAVAAWLGVRLLNRPLRVGQLVIAARRAHVDEALGHDLAFGVAPINADRIEAVNGGPFVLGRDRNAELTRERRALYSAVSAVDMTALADRAEAEADELLAGAGSSLDVVGGYARRVAGHTANRLFGINPPDDALFQEVARAVFAHTFLNLGGDKAIEARAVKAGRLMQAWFGDEIARRRRAKALGTDFMGGLLRQGQVDDNGVRRTLGGMLVGSIDTTASAVAKIVYVLGRDRRLAAAVRADAADLAKMRGWCWEALRRWPHNPLVLRQALIDTTLGGVPVPAGAKVVAWTQAAMHDPQAVPFPDEMRPDRPAQTYLHFGAGLHPCAGRAVNDWQIPMLVGKLMARGVVQAGPIAWAGPFPDRLTVQLGAAR
jgi:cytochrome P450